MEYSNLQFCKFIIIFLCAPISGLKTYTPLLLQTAKIFKGFPQRRCGNIKYFVHIIKKQYSWIFRYCKGEFMMCKNVGFIYWKIRTCC